MTNELHVDAGFPIDLFLERKDDQHLVDELTNLLDPSFTPGPDLWADVVDDGDAGILQTLRKPQIEIGKVDENRSRRRFASIAPQACERRYRAFPEN